jgi:hypothetical protein
MPKHHLMQTKWTAEEKWSASRFGSFTLLKKFQELVE